MTGVEQIQQLILPSLCWSQEQLICPLSEHRFGYEWFFCTTELDIQTAAEYIDWFMFAFAVHAQTQFQLQIKKHKLQTHKQYFKTWCSHVHTAKTQPWLVVSQWLLEYWLFLVLSTFIININPCHYAALAPWDIPARPRVLSCSGHWPCHC